MMLLAILTIGAAACYCDLRRRRIPNVLTLGAAAAGIGLHAATGPWSGIGIGIAGWLVGVAMLSPLFLLRGMGAGDVKLLGAFGAWLGPLAVIEAALAAALIGAMLALALVAAKRRVRRTFANVASICAFWSVAGVRPVPEFTLADPEAPTLRYSMPIVAGVVSVVLIG